MPVGIISDGNDAEKARNPYWKGKMGNKKNDRSSLCLHAIITQSYLYCRNHKKWMDIYTSIMPQPHP